MIEIKHFNNNDNPYEWAQYIPECRVIYKEAVDREPERKLPNFSHYLACTNTFLDDGDVLSIVLEDGKVTAVMLCNEIIDAHYDAEHTVYSAFFILGSRNINKLFKGTIKYLKEEYGTTIFNYTKYVNGNIISKYLTI